jgi:hypothetical protein
MPHPERARQPRRHDDIDDVTDPWKYVLASATTLQCIAIADDAGCHEA